MLNYFCLTSFVANYDKKKLNKKCTKSKIISWVSFNQHKNLENHYRKLLLLYKPFQILEFNLRRTHDSWENAYIEQNNNIKKSKNNLCITLTHQTIMMLNGTI
jgi:hypothetical protein